MNQTLDSRPVQIDMVTQAHGLDSSQYSFNYVTGWATQASGTLTPEQVVRATGQHVIDTVDRILAHSQPEALWIDGALDALEREVDRGVAVAPRWETVADAPNLGAHTERAAEIWSVGAFSPGLAVRR